MSNFSLHNIENYKSEYSHTSAEIFSKYVGIINEFFSHCLDTVYLRNLNYYKYILFKGVETLTHVFKVLLLYTKNLNLTYIHSQKSLYYYVEFICQIGDDNHSFLQLNTKDASLFVYKKTIFDINNEYRKEFASVQDSCDITTNTELSIRLYFNVISSLLRDYEFTQSTKLNFIGYINKNGSKLVQNILNLTLNRTECDYSARLKQADCFSELLTLDKINNIPYLTQFIKQIQKKNVSTESIKKKYISDKNTHNFTNMSRVKYINWLIIN